LKRFISLFLTCVIIVCSFPLVIVSADSEFLYADLLDDLARVIYDGIASSSYTDTELTFDLPEPITVTSTTDGVPSDDDKAESRAIISKACQAAIDAISLDRPDIFWLNFNADGCSFSWSMSGIVPTFTISQIKMTVALKAQYADGIESYASSFNEAIANFEVSGETRYEKLLSIHNALAEITTYDLEDSFAHEATGALLHGKAVCEGYAKSFKLICERENIPCILVSGDSLSDPENEPDATTPHMWNYVQMENGNWYAVDLTWNDTDNTDFGTVTDFFLCGSESIPENFRQFKFSETHIPSEYRTSSSTVAMTPPTLCTERYTADTEEDDPVIESISVKTMPTKTTYILGEEFDPSGLVISLNYVGGTSNDITEGFELSYDISALGTCTVNVAYEDFSTTFEVTVLPVPSSDSLLSSLSVQGYNILPSFSPSVLNYTVTVSENTQYVTISATANDSKASVSGIGSVSFTESRTKTITITCIAEDSSSTTYTIVIKREEPVKSTVSSLDDLWAEGFDLYPTFSEFRNQYTLTLPSDVDSVTINATKTDPKSTVTGIGTITVEQGQRRLVNIVCTAEDGSSTTYAIVIIREAPLPPPETAPSTEPGTAPSTEPGTLPSTTPGTLPSTTPGTLPSTTPGTAPSTEPGTVPSTTPGTLPSTNPDITEPNNTSPESDPDEPLMIDDSIPFYTYIILALAIAGAVGGIFLAATKSKH